MSKTIVIPTGYTPNARGEIHINKLIGVTKDGEYVALDYVFQHSDDFRGATGSSVHVVTNREYKDRTDDDSVRDYCEEIWRIMVSDRSTEQSLDEFVESFKDSDGVDSMFDQSYSYMHDACMEMHNAAVRAKAAEEQELPLEEAEVDEDDLAYICEARGGGRMFSKEGTRGNSWADFSKLTKDASECIRLISLYETKTV